MKFLGLKSPKIPPAPAMPTRDDAADLAARQDALRKRRGSAADLINTGPAGAEAASGASTLLG